MKVEAAACLERLVRETKQSLAFDENNDYQSWKKQIKSKLFELLGMDSIEKNICPLNFEIESEEQMDGYKRIRFTFESETDSVCPCYLLIPDTNKEKYPVVITLQGHSSGFHNSVAMPKNESENEYALGRGAFAVQAVKEGYIALAIEQRGMGERRPEGDNRRGASMCAFTALPDFMLGRTVLGERCWDVSRAIDCLSNFKQCDLDKIAITGNSGGGTMSFYAACYDERIKLSVPSCAFCSYATSILNVHHCSCNYIPNAFKFFEMQDLACLIAPRNVTFITGVEDQIFPIHGVKTAFETVKKIYKKEGKEDNCKLIVTPKGHFWCVDIVWPEIKLQMQKLGWIK